MLLSFGYDKTTLQYNLPDENLLGVLLPNETPAALTGEAEVKARVAKPDRHAAAQRNRTPR
ncbi:MAG: hypothetical protein ACLTB5_13145 [Acutalibacteraceae bacterium]